VDGCHYLGCLRVMVVGRSHYFRKQFFSVKVLFVVFFHFFCFFDTSFGADRQTDRIPLEESPRYQFNEPFEPGVFGQFF
jgi:hypothetical protein